MSADSPKWKKPSDIMKVHLKRRSSLKTAAVSPRPASATSNAGSSPRTRKRKNPFSCSPNKRCCVLKDNSGVEKSDDTGRSSGILFNVLDKKDEAVNCHGVQARVPSEVGVKSAVFPQTKNLNAMEENAASQSEPVTKAQSQETRYQYYPEDWSLKMKARYLSSETFSWCFPLKTVDEVKGMERLVRDLPPPNDKLFGRSAEAKAEFHRSCLYWMHPNIPWLKLFPRITTDNKIGRTSTVLQEKEVLESLMTDWTESFTSVFHLLRASSCPYFYICCHQFTVAFFAASASRQMEAVVTPTSRGFRESIREEGIAFVLPLEPQPSDSDKKHRERIGTQGANTSLNIKKEDKPDEDSGLVGLAKDDGSRQEGAADPGEDSAFDDLEQTDDGAVSWLEALGLDKKRYHSLDPIRVRLQRDSFRLIDNRPESTVLVRGQDVQGLFNFLLNCRSCVANTGVQAGIPPTILSPTTFKGATLRTLKVKPSALRQLSAEGQGFSLEITGPILPTAYARLNHLLTLTQKDYAATYSVLEQTTSFNVIGKNYDTDKENLSSDQSLNVNLGKEAVRELKYSKLGFSWTKY